MKNKMLIVVTIILLIILGIGVTYAWYTWNTDDEDETLIISTSTRVYATVYFDGGSDITGVKILPTATKEEGIEKTVTVRAKEETAFILPFYLYLDIDVLPTALKKESFIYEIYKNGTLVKTGNFSDDYLNNVDDPTNPRLVECTINSTNHIVLIEDTITTTETVYTLYLWINGNMETPLDMSGKTFEFKLHASGENAVLGTESTE